MARTIRQGETVGELAYWRDRRLVQFALLRGPMARCWLRQQRLHEWVKAYPQMMQNLFHTLSDDSNSWPAWRREACRRRG